MNPTERITTPHKTGEAKVIIFSAPSGSGKSTIINYLLAQKLNLAFSISATSRPPRGNEKHGVEYFFLSPDELLIPAQEELIAGIDQKHKIITVDLPEGLLSLDECDDEES